MQKKTPLKNQIREIIIDLSLLRTLPAIHQKSLVTFLAGDNTVLLVYGNTANLKTLLQRLFAFLPTTSP